MAVGDTAEEARKATMTRIALQVCLNAVCMCACAMIQCNTYTVLNSLNYYNRKLHSDHGSWYPRF